MYQSLQGDISAMQLTLWEHPEQLGNNSWFQNDYNNDHQLYLLFNTALVHMFYTRSSLCKFGVFSSCVYTIFHEAS